MKNQKYTYKEYQELLNLSLEEKIMRTEQLILYELKEAKKPLVSCSWGKDSMVVLHLVQKFCKNSIVCFHNTLCQYPETYNYRDKILKEWDIKNYYETKPIKTFWECVKQYGHPEFRKMHGQKNRKSAPKCCYYLKEKPAIDFIKKNNIDLEFIGLQASESMVRRLSFLREGDVFNSKKYKTRICRPVMIWTDEDIWNYHKIHNIPYNPLYDKMKRNGCMPCSAFKNWREVMKKTNPTLYAHISKERGQPLLTEYVRECN